MAQQYQVTADYLLANTKYRPEIGIICGSGLSQLSKGLQNAETFEYSKIPGFPVATVAGHSGELVFGTMGGIQCVCLRGRFHYYEGNSMEQVVLPVRVMRLLGVKLLIVTNAAGGLNENYNVGDIMVIQDHFGLPCVAGQHPLRGPNDDELGPRFVAMSDCYDSALQAMIVDAADKLKIGHKVRSDGTYCFVSGPCYETKVESRFLRSIGGDSVGMSTIPEVIAAKHCGMKILGLSLITNKVVLVDSKDAVHASHAEVLEAANAAGDHVEGLVKHIISKSVLGPYLSAIPAPVYKRKPVAGTAECCPKGGCPCTNGGKCCCKAGECKCKAAGGCCPSAASSSSSSCCPVSKECCPKGECCTTVVTVLGVAAVLTGLFIVLRNKH